MRQAGPARTIQKSQPQSSTNGLIHPYQLSHLTISEIKLMSSFPAEFKLKGSFHEKWARIGNSVPPLLMKAIAGHVQSHPLAGQQQLDSAACALIRRAWYMSPKPTSLE